MTDTATTPEADVHERVKAYYGEELQGSEDLKTNACCASGAPPRWLRAPLERIHDDVSSRFYGCGFPIPEVLDGATVVDLGCGTGRDVYLISQLVGAKGHVHGVDMTDAQLEVANRTRDWHMETYGYSEPNVTFHKGTIEALSELPLPKGEVDAIVSNCVVNLSPRKDLVLAGVHELLREGGEFYISDIVVDRRLAPELADDPMLHGECLSGAMYVGDFLDLCRATGFRDPRVVAEHVVELSDEVRAKVGPATFSSLTLRLFKLPDADTRCEDYGQVATYKGTIAESPLLYRLDHIHLFEAGRPERVCRNTALMLSNTRLGKHFEVSAAIEHFGLHPCNPTMAHDQYPDADTGAGASPASSASTSSCSPGGGCC